MCLSRDVSLLSSSANLLPMQPMQCSAHTNSWSHVLQRAKMPSRVHHFLHLLTLLGLQASTVALGLLSLRRKRMQQQQLTTCTIQSCLAECCVSTTRSP